jgi:hypothetical protein
MTDAICTALEDEDFQCVTISTAASESPEAVRRKLQTAAGDKKLLLVLSEWRSDTHFDTVLIYNATLSVLDQHGTILAEAHTEGRDVLGGNAIDPIGFAAGVVPQAVKRKLQELLNHPDVIIALQSPAGS